ncbi:protein DpdH [Allorhodopirellula solitaria]|uniref:ORC1/DEAH AAA+ ATPase domain-containing protein n=1 Tax=Allorhodopirellula solitaria TaxID=2527987 RepID=A0A5C5WN55_9BACT|nr:protein DpdH [Allorhodopirellula solitaria]TWT52266.1 hypothetical protein CA85_50460 [Allorhodopirellula solitaria]
MNLLEFWPTESECLECIKPEAENPSDAVFLAVHQEMRFRRESFSTKQTESKSQMQLLSEFLRDEPSGRVILPILGESGIGKSHLVRWLKVQLQQREDRDKRHVILIPKSSSLKSVLGRILDGLDGPRYEEIREQLKAAREQMDEIGAKQRIRSELLTAIERNHAEASKRKVQAQQNGSKISEKDKLWLGHGDARCLPSLLNDPATQVLFTKGTSTRPGIISELARHIAKDTTKAESPRRQFERADFLVPEELANDIKEAGQIAGRYLDKLQRTTDTKSLDDAIKLLNGIVDDAIAPLATPTDTSLAELFYEVRRQLLADDRELVLLVEDFAVLAGVQKALLDAIIREGETGGKREACTIRTALAVTDGYFGNLDTVKTRAVHGWHIETGTDSDEDEIMNQIGNFVAAYVNAARIGAKRLENHFADPSNIGKKAPNAIEFLDPEPDEIALLANFGQSVDQYSLFPFNPSAISTIADWRLRDDKGKLKFHPRSVINEIILPVVKDTRGSFERNLFPPPNFLGSEKKIWADLRRDVQRKEGDPERQEQYLYLLHFWADKPERLSQASLPTGVFTAFGLEPLDGSKTAVAPKTLKPLSKPDEKKVGTATTSLPEIDEPEFKRDPPAIQQFVEKLDGWKNGGILGHGDANRIRGLMNIHLIHSVNWEAELLRSFKPTTDVFARQIYLPRAKGNPPNREKAFVVVAEDEQFEDATTANDLFSLIRAMLRYEHNNGWNYEQADEDYISISNFVDLHLAQASSWIHTKYKSVDGNPVSSLTQTLLWQARQLNIESAHKTAEDVSHLEALFADAPKCGRTDGDGEWNDFLDDLVDQRQILKDELLERVGAFQGTSRKTPHAIDASQLLPTIQEFRKAWKISEKFPSMPNSVTDELKAIEKHISSLWRVGNAKVDARRKRIAEQSKLIVAELGKEYDKMALLKDLESVCTLSQQYGLLGEVSVNQIRKLAEKFKTAPVVDAGKQVDAIVNGDDIATQMTAIARLDIETHALLVEFAQTCARFLQERAGKAETKILAWEPDVVEKKKLDVDEILQTLEEAVAPYKKGQK